MLCNRGKSRGDGTIIRFSRRRRVEFLAGMPLPEDIDGLSPAELKLLVVKLLEEVADLRRTVAAQRDEIATPWPANSSRRVRRTRTIANSATTHTPLSSINASAARIAKPASNIFDLPVGRPVSENWRKQTRSYPSKGSLLRCPRFA